MGYKWGMENNGRKASAPKPGKCQVSRVNGGRNCPTDATATRKTVTGVRIELCSGHDASVGRVVGQAVTV